MITYRVDILQALKEAGFNSNRLEKEKILPATTIQHLRHFGPIGFKSLDTICRLLHCQPGDIICWIPDEPSD